MTVELLSWRPDRVFGKNLGFPLTSLVWKLSIDLHLLCLTRKHNKPPNSLVSWKIRTYIYCVDMLLKFPIILFIDIVRVLLFLSWFLGLCSQYQYDKIHLNIYGWIPDRSEELKNLYLRICCLRHSKCFLPICLFKSRKFVAFVKVYAVS